jgi:succinate-semialdehyde dehydrogenase/glutarate-semialdehyde dehydrogenase
MVDLIIANREDLALILTSSRASPDRGAWQIDIGGAYVEFFAEEARRVMGIIPTQRRRAAAHDQQPIGVCGAITTEFLCSMINGKVSLALAAGCRGAQARQ